MTRPMTPLQAQVLGYIAHQGPASVAETASSLMIEESSARDRLNTLERRGLLTIHYTGTRGRAREYAATDAGRALAEDVFGEKDDDELSDEPLPVTIYAFTDGGFERVVHAELHVRSRHLPWDMLNATEQDAVRAARANGGSIQHQHVKVKPGRRLGVQEMWWL